MFSVPAVILAVVVVLLRLALLLLLVVFGFFLLFFDALHFLAVKMVHVSVARLDADAAIVFLVDDLPLDGAAAVEVDYVALGMVVVLRGGSGGYRRYENEN